jgi:hypothetical protein
LKEFFRIFIKAIYTCEAISRQSTSMSIISIYRRSSFYLRYDNRHWKYRINQNIEISPNPIYDLYYILIYFWHILYLKFKLSNEKTAFVPRDNVIFTVFHSNSWFRNPAWDTIISHGRSTVGYYSIPRSRVTRGYHALKQYGVRELLFVISYFRTEYLI